MSAVSCATGADGRTAAPVLPALAPPLAASAAAAFSAPAAFAATFSVASDPEPDYDQALAHFCTPAAT